MYACTLEIGRGFFEGVCTPSNTTANFRDPPHPATQRTGTPLPGLRPEVDHALRYCVRCLSLG
jgi:hypothetical protein